MDFAELTIICGHYGSGKTNLSLNTVLFLARSGFKTTLIDLDIVNPYFRASDSREMLENSGVRVIGPTLAGSTLDVPFLPPEIDGALKGEGHVIIDAGGDDSGATALGRYAGLISLRPYEMIYVVNCYRALSQTPEEALVLLREIETASHLKATSVVNNSHLIGQTEPETILKSVPYAKKVSELSGLPIKFTCVPETLIEKLDIPDAFPVVRLVRTPWEPKV